MVSRRRCATTRAKRPHSPPGGTPQRSAPIHPREISSYYSVRSWFAWDGSSAACGLQAADQLWLRLHDRFRYVLLGRIRPACPRRPTEILERMLLKLTVRFSGLQKALVVGCGGRYVCSSWKNHRPVQQCETTPFSISTLPQQSSNFLFILSLYLLTFHRSNRAHQYYTASNRPLRVQRSPNSGPAQR